MGRAQKKPDAKGPLQRLHDCETARAANEPLVSPFAAQHGDYASEPLVVTTGELGSERAGNLRVVRNRGGSTLQRWMSAQLLSETQASAIAHYSRAWHRVYSEPRVTANL